jgi:ABC-type lipoprotein export system ATPase subunit
MSARQTGETPDVTVVVEGLVRTYGEGENAVHVLRGLDLTARRGELVALYGPSGSGKTTLLNLVGALDMPDAGSIIVDGKNIVTMSEGARANLRRTQIGFVFQADALIPTYTAFENVDLALRLPGFGLSERRRRAKTSLEAVGLSAWAGHVPDELSGGQRQRSPLRAPGLRPLLILADEPTSSSGYADGPAGALSLFRGIARAQGTTFIIVSHDPMIAERSIPP